MCLGLSLPQGLSPAFSKVSRCWQLVLRHLSAQLAATPRLPGAGVWLLFSQNKAVLVTHYKGAGAVLALAQPPGVMAAWHTYADTEGDSMPPCADLCCFSFPNETHFLTPYASDIVVFPPPPHTLGFFYVLRAAEATEALSKGLSDRICVSKHH